MMNQTAQQYHTQANPFFTTAVNIAKYLAKEAIWSEEGCCNWQGAAIEAWDGHYVVVNRTFKADMYNGLSGIALFLAEVLAREKNAVLQTTLEGAVKTILLQSEATPLECHFGLYGGQLGVGFVLWRIGVLNGNPNWRETGLAMVRHLKDHEISEHEVDVLGGAAGAIPALLKIYQIEQDTVFLNLAIQCGRFLVDNAIKGTTSWTWKAVASKQGLTGYSHGNAGIALALLALYQQTQDQAYWQAAMMGFQYEREHFIPQLNNWPDLRELGEKSTPSNTPNCGVMWCHGAPGIGLSRLRAYQITSRVDFLQEARTALQTTATSVANQLSQPQLANYSLCHGVAGNADILLSAGLLLNDVSYIQLAQQAGLLGIALYDKTGTVWPSGVNDPSGNTQGGEETPGLLLGLAGTGYFYLRLAFPSEINSVLLIQ